MLSNIIAVFIGSGLGGVLRWLIGTHLNANYPIGTIVANIAGCFILGVLSRIAPGDEQIKLLLTTGFCGGFTTYSTFMNESFMMMRGGQFLLSLGYIALSIILGLFAAWVGYGIIKS